MGLAPGVLMTLLESFWRFGHWDECSKWQKQHELGLFFPLFASLRVHLGLAAHSLELRCCRDPPGHPEDITTNPDAELTQNTSTELQIFWGQSSLKQNCLWLCCAKTIPGVFFTVRDVVVQPLLHPWTFLGLQILVISPCSEFSPSRD